MKKTIALALSIVLVLASLSCFAQAEDEPKFVTLQEWLDAKGECGNCMLLLKSQYHHFKWWFDNAPIRGQYLQHLKGGAESLPLAASR